MTIQSDNWIKDMVLNHGMITPFVEELACEGVLSYGLSSFGYDARVGNQLKLFKHPEDFSDYPVIDPKNFYPNLVMEITSDDYFIIPPHGFALAETMERFIIPRDILVICVGKSTYARCGIIVNVTPLEPEWEGHVTLELSNTTDIPVKVYANEGICQFLFFKSNEACKISYRDRKGKYQNQKGIITPRIK